METFIFIINLLGTVAFAASGAMCGMKKNMDIFGVCILGLTTAVGGGIIRDLVLGQTPPAAFREPTAAMVALGVSVVLFLGRVRRLLMRDTERYNHLMFWMDALGLGVFSVVGVQTACQHTPDATLFLLVFVGVVTGVGGGVLRDLMAQEVPYIFVKHVYACASLAGALLCALLWELVGSVYAMLIGMAAVVVIRWLANRYHWNLPRARMENLTE